MIFFGSTVSSNFEIEDKINIETSISDKGLPTFEIYGMIAKSIEESKKRIMNSFESLDIQFPLKNININLSPAEYAKHGTHFDLGIAATILRFTNNLNYDEKSTIFLGELSFDGSVKGLKNIIFLVLNAKNLGYLDIYVPLENSKEVSCIEGINIFGISNLKELLNLESILKINTQVRNESKSINSENFRKLIGNMNNKRILAYSLAGKHHLLISGFPGSGKSLLAKASQDLMPDLDFDDAYSVAKIFSYLGIERKFENFLRPPFRSPHSSASYSSILGGVGKEIFPGEITISNKGVLFLDELPEFNRAVLEGLRAPMEDRVISISRSKYKKILPSDFILISTMNPCKCGYFNHPKILCKCSPIEIKRYQNRISGPLLDRVDIFLNYSNNFNLKINDVQTNDSFEEFSILKKKVKEVSEEINSLKIELATKTPETKRDNNFIQSFLTTKSTNLINTIQDNYSISNRKIFKILNLAFTISLFKNQTEIEESNILESLNLSKSIF